MTREEMFQDIESMTVGLDDIPRLKRMVRHAR